MAFTPKEKEISQIIEATHQPEQLPDIDSFESFERKKQFQLDQVAKAAGAKSASDYLDKLIEKL